MYKSTDHGWSIVRDRDAPASLDTNMLGLLARAPYEVEQCLRGRIGDRVERAKPRPCSGAARLGSLRLPRRGALHVIGRSGPGLHTSGRLDGRRSLLIEPVRLTDPHLEPRDLMQELILVPPLVDAGKILRGKISWPKLRARPGKRQWPTLHLSRQPLDDELLLGPDRLKSLLNGRLNPPHVVDAKRLHGPERQVEHAVSEIADIDIGTG